MRAALAVLFLAAASLAAGAVPRTMSYQGVLRDDAGAPVPDEVYTMTFALYESEAGGVSIWGETRDVDVVGGVFNVILGSTNPIDLPFDVQYWLAIEVEHEWLEPREPLTSVPYAGRAAVSDAVDGDVSATTFQLSGITAPGYVLMSDASGTGTWQPSMGGVGGGGTAEYVPKFTGPTTLGNSSIQMSGTMVGINTLPSATLSVNGTMDVEDETYIHSDLHVNGTMDVGGALGVGGDATFDTGLHATNLQSEGNLTLGAGSLNRLSIDGTSGDVGIGTTSPTSRLTVSSPNYDDHILIERPSDVSGHITVGGGHLILNAGTGSPVAIGADGDVGIGTSSPTAKLDVEGTAELTGLRVPTGAGEGLVMTSDAAGNATWQTAPPDENWYDDPGANIHYVGRVGINKVPSMGDLDVAGRVSTEEFLMYPGTKGRALVSDEFGVGTWGLPMVIMDVCYKRYQDGMVLGPMNPYDISVTLDVPGPGYVILTSTVQVMLHHTSGLCDEVVFSHNTDPLSWGCSYDLTWYGISRNWPDSYETMTLPVRSIFSVPAAGSYTYYLIGSSYAEGYDPQDILWGVVMTGIYYPNPSPQTLPPPDCYKAETAEEMWRVYHEQIE